MSDKHSTNTCFFFFFFFLFFFFFFFLFFRLKYSVFSFPLNNPKTFLLHLYKHPLLSSKQIHQLLRTSLSLSLCLGYRSVAISMDEMTKKESCRPCLTLPGLAMHQDSKKISKPKPKIRIIHIFAPEIIKTDVANFRELVQQLTGKPAEKGCKKKPRIPRREEPRSASSTDKPPVVKKMEGMWNGENSDGFLGGFADLEGFIQELGELPFLPFDASHMHGFGEAQLA
jgi:hypothetical protein